MNSIRKFVYVTALALSALTFTPTPAAAEDTKGAFTLAHDVHWQNADVPAGEYEFSVVSRGPSELLVLRKVSGASAGFMFFVNDADQAPSPTADSLTVLARPDGRFVSSMTLRDAGLTLHFTVPSETRELATIVSASR